MDDRFGLGWRPELAYGILSNLDQIDVVEVMADDLFQASSQQISAIQTLARQIPVILHGVSLGLASSAPVATSRLDAIARVVNKVQPEFWSEHLAFVRAGDIEIGHLTVPPRTNATLEGTIHNIIKARSIVGTNPLLENIATLIEPPASTYDELTWLSYLLSESSFGLLLDLNNLYTNATNFGYNPMDFLACLPFERIRAIHLAGGRWVFSESGKQRLLDDHRHNIPDPVYQLLTEVGSRATHSLTVILERDGSYPPFSELLIQLKYAREALNKGRALAIEQKPWQPPSFPLVKSETGTSKEALELEHSIAQLYTNREFQKQFLIKLQNGIKSSNDKQRDFAYIDKVGLELTTKSLARKRMHLKKSL